MSGRAALLRTHSDGLIRLPQRAAPPAQTLTFRPT